MRWSAPGWRNAVLALVVEAVLFAAFPRAARWLGRPAGLGPRAMAGYVLWATMLTFGAGEFAHHIRSYHDDLVAEARARLGREPTRDDIRDHYARRMLRERLGREPSDDEVERALQPDTA
jgi:hypothetical protein